MVHRLWKREGKNAVKRRRVRRTVVVSEIVEVLWWVVVGDGIGFEVEVGIGFTLAGLI